MPSRRGTASGLVVGLQQYAAASISATENSDSAQLNTDMAIVASSLACKGKQ